MKNTEQATARPWKLILPIFKEEGEETEEGGMVGVIMGDRIDSPGSFTVGNEIVLDSNCCPADNEIAEANARLIVKAVNSHDELVEALKLAIATIQDMGVDISGTIPTGEKLNYLKQALKNAGEL